MDEEESKKEHWDNLVKRYNYSIDTFDRLKVEISGIGLGLVSAFFKMPDDLVCQAYRYIYISAIVFFALGLIVGFWTDLHASNNSMDLLKRMSKAATDDEDYHDDSAEEKENKKIKCLNFCVFICVFLGIASVSVISILSLF